MYAAIVGRDSNGIDLEMELGSSITLNLDEYQAGTRGGPSRSEAGTAIWRYASSRGNQYTAAAVATVTPPRTMRVTARFLGEHTFTAVPDYGDSLTIHVSVVRASDILRSHPEEEALTHNPLQTGYLLVGDTLKARYPVECKWNLHLGPGDDGTGRAIVYTDDYVRPGEQFLFPDDHVGTIQGVRPIYLRATGKRIASALTVGGVYAREAPDSACIANPPTSLTVGVNHGFSVCTHEPGVTYYWDARNDEGRSVGRWTDRGSATTTFTPPDEPQRLHVTLKTTQGEHDHIHGFQVWVMSADTDYAPVPVPQPVQPGDPARRKRYEIDIRYGDMTLELSGKSIDFATEDGVPIMEPVQRPAIGPFRFWAEGASGMDGRLEATLHGVVHVSLFTL